ncbi:MAG: hypothetical protein JSU72_00850 [Deltaproteobacteria bacterium]|nr:MAG: hypothetical protein JSU72_00850 [Deltaproteobacteria bacterium]
MLNQSSRYVDRRKKSDRRTGGDRRTGSDRRQGGERRSGADRRGAWEQALDQRFQGALRTVATVSHLFSQPLTVVMGHVDLLSASTEDEHLKHTLHIIKEQLELLSKYIHYLRELNKFETKDLHGLTMLDIGLPDVEE